MILFGFEISDQTFVIAGIALILLVVVQLTFWVGGSIGSWVAARKRFQVDLQILQEKLEAAKLERVIAEGEAGWSGLRTFRVSKLVREAENITSIYLTPQDRRPLPFFRPGQFLTFSFEFPDEKKPVVRCYSLSDAPNPEFYRCTIKAVPPPPDQPDAPPGRISNYVNSRLQEGDLVHVKAPAGSFYIDLNDERPVILLAGGIGITPLFSMLASIVKFQPHRRVVLFYGGKNSADHAFKNEIQAIAQRHRNIHVVNCYSEPLDSDRLGETHDINGWVNLELVQSMLPSSNFLFYICGPPAFMESMVQGLETWGVPTKSIHYEAFGPASIRKTGEQKPKVSQPDRMTKIRFARSDVEVEWSPEFDSILDAAEQAGVDVDSGCRAGNCGSCQIAILKGKTRFTKEPGCEPQEGCTLSCISIPEGDLEIDG